MDMKTMSKKAAAALLAAVLALSGTAAVSVSAEEHPADQAASPKEEVVYGELAGDGRVKNIYVVNIFEGQKDIVDYGNYTQVRNMTSRDAITRDRGKITLHTEDDTLYYQGNLEEGELPWDMEIAYFLNGEKIQPQDLAGKSGNLEIRMNIGENKKAFPAFFENYALQVTAVLDTEKCRNIETKGATEANAGGNRQLTWTLLPQTGRSIKIKTRVTDFEMEPISFNGVKLNLDVKVDSSQLEEQFSDLETTIKAIDSGAKKLSAGTRTFSLGAERLRLGTDRINGEIESLSGKIRDARQLESASAQIKGAVNALAQGTSKIREAVSYSAFKAQLKQKGLDLDGLKGGNQQLLGTLSSLKAMENIPPEYRQQILQAEQVLKGNLAAIEGMERYLEGAAKGIAETEGGAKALSESYEAFDSAVGELSSRFSDLDLSGLQELKEGADSLARGSGALSDASSALAGGTGALSSSTSGMSGRIDAAIGEMTSRVSGKREKVVSFVSEKNTNVKAVQFVIKNDPIEIAAEEPPAETEPEHQTWLQKIQKLFKAS